jgi:putative transposase
MDSMSRFMHRAQRQATIDHHRRHDATGHLWQGRYKGFPVQEDSHFLTVIRYVLQNPMRAGIVSTAREYRWNSLSHPELVDPWPVDRPADLDGWLTEPLNDGELRDLRHSTNRQFPFGSTSWIAKTATQLGIKLGARPGRPPMLPKLGTGTRSKA